MRKGKFLRLLSVLTVAKLLFLYKIATVGNGDITGGILVAVLSLLIIALLYFKIYWIRWIGLIWFAFFSIACVIAGLANRDPVFFFISAGFAWIAYQLITVKKPTYTSEEPPRSATEIPANTFARDHAVYVYPTLLKRVQALFIDGSLIFILMIFLMTMFSESEYRAAIMIGSALAFSLLYEPMLTAYSATIGQRIVGIRVRSIDNVSKNISLPQAFSRVIVKDLLGWASFVTIHFNREHRAIHDFAGSSVMIKI